MLYCSGFVAMSTHVVMNFPISCCSPRRCRPFAPPPHLLRRSRPASASPSPCSLVSSWLDTGEMNTLQWKNTNNIQYKDASTGRNTNTSFLVATDMHATETLNQQWETTSSCHPYHPITPSDLAAFAAGSGSSVGSALHATWAVSSYGGVSRSFFLVLSRRRRPFSSLVVVVVVVSSSSTIWATSSAWLYDEENISCGQILHWRQLRKPCASAADFKGVKTGSGIPHRLFGRMRRLHCGGRFRCLS